MLDVIKAGIINFNEKSQFRVTKVNFTSLKILIENFKLLQTDRQRGNGRVYRTYEVINALQVHACHRKLKG